MKKHDSVYVIIDKLTKTTHISSIELKISIQKLVHTHE